MKIVVLIAFLMTTSITSYSQGYESKQEWISSYKESVCFSGFTAGLGDFNLATKLVRTDKSFYDPFFYTLHQKAIDRGVNYLVGLIKKDSADREGRVSEPAAGKRSLLISFHFYTSKKLNEIAEQEYFNWIKTPNKKKLIDKVKMIY